MYPKVKIIGGGDQRIDQLHASDLSNGEDKMTDKEREENKLEIRNRRDFY